MSEYTDWIGRLVGGRYRVRSLLGMGASSWVFQAEQPNGPDVALKVSRRPGDNVYLARFQREAQAVRRLQHPACVRVIASGVEQHDAYVAMELVEGEELQDIIGREGTLAQARAVAIACTLCE